MNRKSVVDEKPLHAYAERFCRSPFFSPVVWKAHEGVVEKGRRGFRSDFRAETFKDLERAAPEKRRLMLLIS